MIYYEEIRTSESSAAGGLDEQRVWGRPLDHPVNSSMTNEKFTVVDGENTTKHVDLCVYDV